MDRKLFGIFSGRQLTAIAITAILAPSALYAAVTYTAVAIVDPNTGSKAFVDPARRLYVYDPIAGYKNYPANLVNSIFTVSNGVCQTAYTVPSGKALVLTEVTFFLKPYTIGQEVYAYLYRSDCSTFIGGGIAKGDGSTQVVDPLGAGVVVPAGQTIKNFGSNSNISYGVLRGYLVPATAVPAVGSAEAAMQSGPPGPPLPSKRN